MQSLIQPNGHIQNFLKCGLLCSAYVFIVDVDKCTFICLEILILCNSVNVASFVEV